MDPHDHAMAPCVPHFNALQGLLTLSDISMEGACITTRFPSAMRFIELNKTDLKVEFHFPLDEPITISVDTKWQKRLKEHTADAEGKITTTTTHLAGIQFKGKSVEFPKKLKLFIRAITEIDTI